MGGGRPGSQSGGFQYQSQVDPEELFRTIFGDAFRRGQGFESMFDGFGSESQQQQQYEAAQVRRHFLNLKKYNSPTLERFNLALHLT